MGSVIDYVGRQMEPRKRPESIPPGDEARHEGPQICEDPHVGPRSGGREEALLATRPMCYQRYGAASDEGGVVGG